MNCFDDTALFREIHARLKMYAYDAWAVFTCNGTYTTLFVVFFFFAKGLCAKRNPKHLAHVNSLLLSLSLPHVRLLGFQKAFKAFVIDCFYCVFFHEEIWRCVFVFWFNIAVLSVVQNKKRSLFYVCLCIWETKLSEALSNLLPVH